MRTLLLVTCLALSAVGQRFEAAQQALHLESLHQPHLPKDDNVIAATQLFLDQFNALKAISDAAPDPEVDTHRFSAPPALPPRRQAPAPAPFRPRPGPAPVRASAPVRAAPLPPPPPPPPAAPRAPAQPALEPTSLTERGSFDVHGQIRDLLAKHGRTATPPPRRPAPAPRPAAPPRRAPPPQTTSFQTVPSTFTVQNEFITSAPAQPARQAQPFQSFLEFAPETAPRRTAPRPTSRPAFNPDIPITNQEGIVVNPRQFAGPLAHSEPAGVSGPVQNTPFTKEVADAHRALAEAHAQALAIQESLPPPPPPRQLRRL